MPPPTDPGGEGIAGHTGRSVTPRAIVAPALAIVITVVIASVPAPVGASPSPPRVSSAAALDSLARARTLFVARRGPAGIDATMVLRDLTLSLPSLVGADRSAALALLRRPPDGNGDPRGDGYSVASRFVCGAHVCVHWVDSTSDAPPAADANGNQVPDQVERTMAALDAAWNAEVGTMGFRPPMSDGTSRDHGPNAKLDVYLADVGADGLDGYTATDDPHSSSNGYPYRNYSAYLVLDNDFSTSQLGMSGGIGGLRVTAAHEFFHTIQYGYDAGEDAWMMEGTAVWMEDQVAGDVNANRRWLRQSPLTQPWVPIDSSRDLHEYGAWIFWRFLSESEGRHAPETWMIRRIWDLAADRPGAPNLFSASAVEQALAERGTSFRGALATFGVWNLVPAAFYQEGAAYPRAPFEQSHRVTVGDPVAGWATIRLNHLTTGSASFEPGPGAPAGARLRLMLDAPPIRTGSAARVVVFERSGAFRVITVSLNHLGDATVTVPFGLASVGRIVLLFANAGTSFKCWTGAAYSCHGVSRVDAMPYSYVAQLVR